jgi:hypothetical protein
MNQPLANIQKEEFDYVTLCQALADYARPRDKIRSMLRKQEIVRIKKGLYILGESYRKRPFSRELLANLIYGPSYISLEYALSYHGLIPERVETITSTTCGGSRSFTTPIGLFTYWSVHGGYYSAGVDLVSNAADVSFLMATPEKALADKILRDRGLNIISKKDLTAYLQDDLRIDEEALKHLDIKLIEAIAGRTNSRKVKLLFDYVRSTKGGVE